MERLKHILLITLLIASKQPTLAQQSVSLNENQNVSINETVFIHSNATTFVSGETLYYKLYCLNATNKTPSAISKIAYVELIDSDKKSVFRNKLFLEKSNGQGDYFVPTTLKTGNYKLIGYTNWILNQPASEIFQMDIRVINPFQPNNAKSTDATIDAINLKIEKKPNSQNLENLNSDDNPMKKVFSSNQNKKGGPDNHAQTTTFSEENEDLKFNLNKKIFANREQITLKIESSIQPKKGSYSLSVRKLDDLPTKNQISTSNFAEKSISTIIKFQDKKVKITLPELRGEMISGKITAKNGTNEVHDVLIGLSIPGKSFAFKVVKTDSGGNFIFNLDKAFYSSNIIIQIMDENRNNYSIALDNPPGVDYSKLSFEPNINLTSELKESLLNRSIASQIENAYYHKKTDSITKERQINSFYEPIAKEYLLDDYTRFSTLKETSTEIVKEMYYRQKNNNYSLYVTDMSIYTQLPDPALVLIDGLLIQNVNELFEYKMKNIHKISVIPGLYYLGPKAFNGLISFTTKNNDFTSTQNGDYILKPSILRPTVKKEYYRPNYMDMAKAERIPDFRYQLLWMPDLTLDNTKNPISFYASDISGTFEIVLEGFTDKGIPVTLKETFEVK